MTTKFKCDVTIRICIILIEYGEHNGIRLFSEDIKFSLASIKLNIVRDLVADTN